MEEKFWVWTAALESGYLSLRDLIRWTDAEIVRLQDPPGWLIDLSLAQSVDEAIAVLWQAWARHGEARGFARESSREWGQLYLGFLYLRYERGGLDMPQLLTFAGGNADAVDCGIGCDAFYQLLNEIDGEGPTIPSSRPLVERIAERFSHFVILTRQYLNELPVIPDVPA